MELEKRISFRFGYGCFFCVESILNRIPALDYSFISVSIDVVQLDSTFPLVSDVLDQYSIGTENV